MNILPGYTFHEECPERGIIGRVVRAERLGRGSYGRVSYEVDCIDADISLHQFKEGLHEEAANRGFAVVRVVTTPRRFSQFLGQSPAIGDWIKLEIGPRYKFSGPIVYHSQLTESGYNNQSRGVLLSATFLFSDLGEDYPRKPLNSAANPIFLLAQDVADICRFHNKSINQNCEVETALRRAPKAQQVIVRDVGQANFVTLVDAKGGAILHVDAGWPISFNGRTAPKWTSIGPDSAPIVLTHWDFDHLLAFYAFRHTRDSLWIAPRQKLGPGQKRVAQLLANKRKLLVWTGGCVRMGVGVLIRCSGSHPMNDTGIAFIASLRCGDEVLIAGDAAYQSMEGRFARIKYNYVVVTHHGANFEGSAPVAAAVGSRGVISVGRGNVYRHPRAEARAKHELNGWTMLETAGSEEYPRRDILLGCYD